MKSRWLPLKPEATRLRRLGKSLPHIEAELGIPRSTLSGWLRDVPLTERHRKLLDKRWREGLVAARVKASEWHRTQKELRLKRISDECEEFLADIRPDDRPLLEIAMALLYLGEGAKKSNATVLGNSDPLILRFYIRGLQALYSVPIEKIYCELHLRADQDPEKMKRYWSRAVGVPLRNFRSVSLDKRTAGSATYSHYKGVCLVRCGRVEIQRRLVYIARGFCEKVAQISR